MVNAISQRLGYYLATLATILGLFSQVERTPIIAPLESREAWLVTGFASPEKCSEGLVQSLQRIPLDPYRDARHGGIIGPPGSQHFILLIAIDGLFAALVGFLPVLQEMVPDPAAAVEIVEEGLLLGGSRIESDCHCCEHSSIVAGRGSLVNQLDGKLGHYCFPTLAIADRSRPARGSFVASERPGTKP